MIHRSHLALLSAILLVASFASAQPYTLAGITFGTNVTEHAKIDQDIKRIQDLLAAGDQGTAKNIYENGENSRKSTSMRSLRGFSTSNVNDSTNLLFQNYYLGSTTFEDDFVQGAFAGLGVFANRDLPTRAAAITTAIKAMNTWMYIVHEMEDGYKECLDRSTATDQYIGGPVSSIDEAWAFYAGSLEGPNVAGSANGVGLFRLAVDMCNNFGTCVTLQDGSRGSPVNIQVAGNMTLLALAAQREGNPCPQTRALTDNIINRMRVPLIQGLLFNVFSSAKAISADDRNKFWANSWAFYASLAPFVKRCAPSADAQIKAQLAQPGFNVTIAQNISATIESTYLCLAVTCADVGNMGPDQKQCTDRTLAGYDFRSNVMDRAFIDLDLQRIAVLLGNNQWEQALGLYRSGMHSVKANGVVRTIAGMSENFASFTQEPTWQIYVKYYQNDLKYGNSFVVNALTDAFPRANDNPIMRREVALKSMQYMILWNYIIHELEESVRKCKAQASGSDKDGDFVVDVDEAWAFYTGSLLWGSGSAAVSGLGMYSAGLARCKEFKTCTNGTGSAQVNDKIMAEMAKMQSASEAKDCATLESSLDAIKPQMLVPIIQGLLKYAYLADSKLTSTPGFTRTADLRKEWAEGYVFYSSVAPMLAQCDPAVDTLVKDNINLNLNPSALMKDGYVAVSRAIQSTFPCLRISCSDIGFIHPSVQCSDPIAPFALNYAGYPLASNVTDRGRIDLDLKDIDKFMSLGNFVAAEELYLNGKYSVKSNGETRTLFKLSSDFNKFAKESTWNLFRNYYNSTNFADGLILDALQNKAPFSSKPAIFRREVSLKIMQYVTMLNYVMHELEEALGDCKEGLEVGLTDLSDGDRAVDVDEGWAFFTGSLHVPKVNNTGFLFYFANLRRCREFKTCTSSGTRSITNDRTLALFLTAQTAAAGMNCKKLEESMIEIRSRMLVPIIQGLLKYVYLADKSNPTKPLATPGSDLQEEWAEGFAFAYAALPFIDQCDKNVASLVRQNLWVTSPIAMQSGAEAVTKAIQSTFPCLNLTCSEVGAYVDSLRCQDSLSSSSSSSSTLSGGAIAGIVIACVVFYMISLLACYKRGKKSGADAANQVQSIEAKAAPKSNAALNGVHNGGSKMEQVEVV